MKLIIEKCRSKEQYQNGLFEADGRKFSTLLLPILLQTKDLEALSFLIKQTTFSLTFKDVKNFIEKAFSDKWNMGAKALLGSVPTFIAYQS